MKNPNKTGQEKYNANVLNVWKIQAHGTRVMSNAE